MKDNRSLYICRVCGFKHKEPIWGKEGNCPTYQICDCCGVEFGYQDCSLQAIREFRKNWVKRGCCWENDKIRPRSWSIEEQMKNIPKEYL
ncbi:MAG: hypothetical protein FJZ56_07160 [Chlamydiae bacterium]|nr:hypothetical protein [Chlamydiota bacterium]